MRFRFTRAYMPCHSYITDHHLLLHQVLCRQFCWFLQHKELPRIFSKVQMATVTVVATEMNLLTVNCVFKVINRTFRVFIAHYISFRCRHSFMISILHAFCTRYWFSTYVLVVSTAFYFLIRDKQHILGIIKLLENGK